MLHAFALAAQLSRADALKADVKACENEYVISVSFGIEAVEARHGGNAKKADDLLTVANFHHDNYEACVAAVNNEIKLWVTEMDESEKPS